MLSKQSQHYCVEWKFKYFEHIQWTNALLTLDQYQHYYVQFHGKYTIKFMFQ